jgi:hypothetical protein
MLVITFHGVIIVYVLIITFGSLHVLFANVNSSNFKATRDNLL